MLSGRWRALSDPGEPWWPGSAPAGLSQNPASAWPQIADRPAWRDRSDSSTPGWLLRCRTRRSIRSDRWSPDSSQTLTGLTPNRCRPRSIQIASALAQDSILRRRWMVSGAERPSRAQAPPLSQWRWCEESKDAIPEPAVLSSAPSGLRRNSAGPKALACRLPDRRSSGKVCPSPGRMRSSSCRSPWPHIRRLCRPREPDRPVRPQWTGPEQLPKRCRRLCETPRRGRCRNRAGCSYLCSSLSSPPEFRISVPGDSRRGSRYCVPPKPTRPRNPRYRSRKAVPSTAPGTVTLPYAPSLSQRPLAPIDLCRRKPSVGIPVSDREVVLSYPQFDPYCTKSRLTGQGLFFSERGGGSESAYTDPHAVRREGRETRTSAGPDAGPERRIWCIRTAIVRLESGRGPSTPQATAGDRIRTIQRPRRT